MPFTWSSTQSRPINGFKMNILLLTDSIDEASGESLSATTAAIITSRVLVASSTLITRNKFKVYIYIITAKRNTPDTSDKRMISLPLQHCSRCNMHIICQQIKHWTFISETIWLQGLLESSLLLSEYQRPRHLLEAQTNCLILVPLVEERFQPAKPDVKVGSYDSRIQY